VLSLTDNDRGKEQGIDRSYGAFERGTEAHSQNPSGIEGRVKGRSDTVFSLGGIRDQLGKEGTPSGKEAFFRKNSTVRTRNGKIIAVGGGWEFP